MCCTCVGAGCICCGLLMSAIFITRRDNIDMSMEVRKPTRNQKLVGAKMRMKCHASVTKSTKKLYEHYMISPPECHASHSCEPQKKNSAPLQKNSNCLFSLPILPPLLGITGLLCHCGPSGGLKEPKLFCYTHLWATAIFLPRFETLGTTQTTQVM